MLDGEALLSYSIQKCVHVRLADRQQPAVPIDGRTGSVVEIKQRLEHKARIVNGVTLIGCELLVLHKFAQCNNGTRVFQFAAATGRSGVERCPRHPRNPCDARAQDT